MDLELVPIIYVALFAAMMLMLYLSGKHLDKAQYIALGIIAFTLNEGLRFGRGIDYNMYAANFYDIKNGGIDDWDIGFRLLNEFVFHIGGNWQIIVMIMSFTLILSGYFLAKEHEDVAKLMLPLFAYFTLAAETLMRWYFALSLIWIGICFLLNKKNKYAIALFLLSLTVHIGTIIVLPIFILFLFFKKPLLNPVWTFSLYIVIALFFQTDIMLNLMPLLDGLSLGERYSGYQDNLEYWLTSGFAGVEQSAFPAIYKLLEYILIIFLGYKLCFIKSSKYTLAYNIYVLAFLLEPLSRKIELFQRVDYSFSMFGAIVLAYILVNYKLVYRKGIVTFFILFVMLNSSRVVLVSAFSGSPYHYLYVWNSNGKKYIDPGKYYIDYWSKKH